MNVLQTEPSRAGRETENGPGDMEEKKKPKKTLTQTKFLVHSKLAH